MTVSKGYPEKYEKGKVIRGLEFVNDSFLFHSGTKKENQNIVTSGGRVIAVTSMDKQLNKALKSLTKLYQKLNFREKLSEMTLVLTSREMNVLLRPYPLLLYRQNL